MHPWLLAVPTLRLALHPSDQPIHPHLHHSLYPHYHLQDPTFLTVKPWWQHLVPVQMNSMLQVACSELVSPILSSSNPHKAGTSLWHVHEVRMTYRYYLSPYERREYMIAIRVLTGSCHCIWDTIPLFRESLLHWTPLYFEPLFLLLTPIKLKDDPNPLSHFLIIEPEWSYRIFLDSNIFLYQIINIESE